MSRIASSGARPVGGGVESLAQINAEDMCPICKTSRYMNKDLEFLINPECYHPMCSTCVNRLFNDAPAQCPTAGCFKTLRRKAFRSAFFGDLGVEREVDIRRRVAAVFNQQDEDFESLRAYNDYLQQVEDLTFDLVHGSDAARKEAEARLAQWEVEHRAEIEKNRKLGREAEEKGRRKIEAEREAARQRLIDAVRELETEKAARARDREEQLDILAKAEQGKAKVVLKKRVKNNTGGPGVADPSTSFSSAAGEAATDLGKLAIHGLKVKPRPQKADGPYDPFGGMDMQPTRYTFQADLVKYHPWENNQFIDSTILTGGYNYDDWTERAMFEAFSGLGVLIGEEKDRLSAEAVCVE